MLRNISYGTAWLARGAAALAVLAVMSVVALVGVLVMLAVLFGMLALPSREPPRTRPSGSPVKNRRGLPGLLRPRLRPRS
jgi:hypothetical protein